jgi:hypothetical protein
VRPWTAVIWTDFRHLFWLKTVGITLFMMLFFVGYFHVLRNPRFPAFEMPLTPLDHWMPFQPGALAAYASLWVYVGIPPGIQRNLRELLAYGAWIAALSVTGLLIFYLWPTVIPRAADFVDLGQHPAFSILHGVDAPGNACPSLHVATATFSVLWLRRLLTDARAPVWLRALNWVWWALIVHSTVAIRQHVVLDAVAGMALGLAFALASLYGRRRDLAPRAAAVRTA